MRKNLGNIVAIYEPDVHLTAKTAFQGMPDDIQKRWSTDPMTSGAEFLMEASGRACYQSWHNPASRKNYEYLQNIIKQGHESVLEHASYSFYCRGISRSLTHELVRHRTGVAFSQLSQRYVDESEVAFVVPPAFIGNTSLETMWAQSCEDALMNYRTILQAMSTQSEFKDAKIKEKREAARSVLPNCAETHISFTCNLRQLRHIFTMRGSLAADAEIRRFALRLFDIMQQEPCSFIFFDFKLEEENGKQYLSRLTLED